ncbi:sirohydrochlorin cobaltochelatase [Geothermobacter hydrogeniphilus]|uniref:Sirohydrochlorin cobaltochelatase n=1 Tax=Geothermobacter hydrogeniphilus TaxID=1969733 RepID=A0A1X0YAK8_9BACT|nr:sirohydrochlorin cobaltochelatase [Geothermobacter hydrogeniphilus]ORJ62129.1 sirohydrochlorin cobaltochelatase [Geothermobacter hydrogeniphilus]
MKKSVVFTVALAFLLSTQMVQAAEYKVVHKNGIVLAMFGTTVEPALQGLLNIRDKMKKAYPETPVRFAFTSNIIRKIWQKRAADPAYIKAHPNIPPEILHVQGPLATIANFQDDGYDTLVVQPTHIAPAEEFLDLTAYVDALASIDTIKKKFKPFNKLVIGRPMLGTFGVEHPYAEDIKTAVRAMREDVDRARKNGAALVYMGHGNDHFPSGGSYLQFEHEMNKVYPDVKTVIGTVEGYPAVEQVLETLKRSGVKKVVIRAFMIVAGDHATNDMAGPEKDSWKSIFEKEGIEVLPYLHGMGENDRVADIFVRHAADAAADAGIVLK